MLHPIFQRPTRDPARCTRLCRSRKIANAQFVVLSVALFAAIAAVGTNANAQSQLSFPTTFPDTAETKQPERSEQQTESGSTSTLTFADLAQHLKSGQIENAVDAVTKHDEQVTHRKLANVDTTLLLAQVARGAENVGKTEIAADLYLRACAAANRPAAASNLTAKQIALIQLAAGSSLVRAGQTENAIDVLAQAMGYDSSRSPQQSALPNQLANESHSKQTTSQLSPQQRATAAELLSLLGSEALSGNKTALAEKAYATALPYVSETASATVRLGHAWSIALQKDRDQDAALALTDFIQRHPNHSDIASAAKLCVAKLDAVGDVQSRDAMMSRLLMRWSDSAAASDLVRQYASKPSNSLPAPVQTWMLSRTTADRIAKLDAPTSAAALIVAIEAQQVETSDLIAARLAASDQTGQAVSDALQYLAENRRAADAEQLATRLVSPLATTEQQAETVNHSVDHTPANITPAAREAACRWAGRRQLWTLLAMASEASDTKTDEPSRTITVERLFAESLMQTGRAVDAQVWWNHLVDSRGVNDFATLLRCAEAATAHADVLVATNRIADAKVAAEGFANKESLVQMLAAEMAVRELRFDQARSELEQIVRSDGAIAALRGRAQWTIGETYYLQEKFAQAIEAYRKVEGIDPDGDWIAISLVQAGKSFEQLGRTREAAVCYSTLVSRFAKSPHTVAARRRLAAINPSSVPSTDTLRR